jgi:hypothetical protein
MSFTSFNTTSMQWDGTTSWTNPDTGTLHTGVPIRTIVTITASNPAGMIFVSPPTGAPAGIGATVRVVDPAGSCTGFTMNVQTFADIPTDASGYIPINTVRSSGTTRSTFTPAFYFVP